MKLHSVLVATLMCAGLAVGTTALAATTCKDGSSFTTVSISSGALILQENFYKSNGGELCVDHSYSKTFAGAFTVRNTNSVPTNGAPSGYPSLFKGCHWGTCSSNSGMPKRVKDIKSMSSSWTYYNSNVGGSWNAAYDIWFDTGSAPGGQPNGTELMVWANWNGSVRPIGNWIERKTISGHPFDIWIGKNSGDGKTWNVISFAVQGGKAFQPSSLDLKAFIDYALAAKARNNNSNLPLEDNVLSKNWYLIDIEAGFEVWDGGDGLRTDYFDASVK
jgi:hypothetical protein